ncbi:MAG: ATP-grasp domain-containing protein [Gammaproteobacteria bacterium]|nr:ATP-grasp domain-containing protein [Gammaproteobacteria bacterium]
MITVMVTGVGAIIGYGVLRSFHKLDRDIRLIGTDIYPDAVGQAWSDRFFVAPLTSSDGYLAWLEKTIAENNVDLVIPGIEQDLHFFSDHRDIFSESSVSVVLNEHRLINLTRDKWLMHQELASINSDARIDSYLEGDFHTLSKKLKLPFILKPRHGYASKGMIRVHDEMDFMLSAEKLGHDLMAQPIIGCDEEEYTVGVFGNGLGTVNAFIVFKRRLAADGSTVKAWVRHDEQLYEVVSTLCAHFKPIGPTNLQFRKHGDCWKLLEINPRISSSTSLRTAFGYNEAEMCLDYYLDGKVITQPEVRGGFAARYIEDYIVYDRDHF